MADSALVTKWIPAYAGNYTKNRAAQGGRISEITVHHCAMVGVTVEELGALWQRKGRNGSSHYGVCGGATGQYVAEGDVAWTNGNWGSNCRAVTIEVSNDGGAPDWHVSDASIETLKKLVADIAWRNGLHPLVYGKTLTWHGMYAATACPGPYLKGRLAEVCDGANAINEARGAAAPLSERPVTLLIGPASAGDAATMRRVADALSLPCTDSGDGMLHIGPASAGDQSKILTEAARLGLAAAVDGAQTEQPGAAEGAEQPDPAEKESAGEAEKPVPAEKESAGDKADESPTLLKYIVQAGVFVQKENAENHAAALKKQGVETVVREVDV